MRACPARTWNDTLDLSPPSPDDAPAQRLVLRRGGRRDEALAACAAWPRAGSRRCRRWPIPPRSRVRVARDAAGQRGAGALEGGRLRRGPGGGRRGCADRPRRSRAAAGRGGGHGLASPDLPLMVLAADVDHLRHVNDTVACDRATRCCRPARASCARSRARTTCSRARRATCS